MALPYKVLRWAEQAVDSLLEMRTYPAAEHIKAPMRVAHRGAWDALVIENTMPAFARAAAVGMEGIEFDVHFTADGVPVVHHDPDLHRLYGIVNPIESLKFADLKRVVPGIPSLEEVVALPHLHFMIEIKTALSNAQLETLSSVLNRFTAARDFHLLSLDPELVRESSAFPAAAWVLVGQVQLGKLCDIAIAHEYGGVAGHYLGMTDAMIARLHERRLAAGAGFIPSKNLLNRERARGVDWVFTNTAERIGNGGR